MLINPASRHRKKVLAVIALLPLISGVAACGSSSGTKPSGSSGAESAAIAAAPAGTFANKPATGSAITVGVISPEGGAAISQPEGRVAAQAAVAYANAHLGGIAGHLIKLDICKEQEDIPSATACANKLVQDKVAAVVVLNTGADAAIAPIITNAGIAYTSYNATSPQALANPASFIWTSAAPGAVAGMAKAAAMGGVKTFSLFVTDSTQVVGGITALATPIFKAAGISLKIVPIPAGTPDATSQVTAGIQNKPQAVGVIGDATMCSPTLSGLDTAGFTGPRYVITPCVDNAVTTAVGAAGFKNAKLVTTTNGDGTDAQARLYRAVMAKYAPGATTAGAAQTGFQSMLGFIRAAQGTTGTDAASILKALKSAKGMALPLGTGAVMSCDGKAFPGLTSLCSNSVTIASFNGTTPVDFAVQ